MTDIADLVERQAEWQKSRRHLSWPEKVRLVEAVHEAIRQFRGVGARGTAGPAADERRAPEGTRRRPDRG